MRFVFALSAVALVVGCGWGDKSSPDLPEDLLRRHEAYEASDFYARYRGEAGPSPVMIDLYKTGSSTRLEVDRGDGSPFVAFADYDDEEASYICLLAESALDSLDGSRCFASELHAVDTAALAPFVAFFSEGYGMSGLEESDKRLIAGVQASCYSDELDELCVGPNGELLRQSWPYLEDARTDITAVEVSTDPALVHAAPTYEVVWDQ